MRIDWWTLAIQFGNVAILVWLLGHFFWRPVAAMIAARQETAAKLLADAEAAGKAAEAARQEIAATRAGFAAERETILETARQEGARIRAGIVEGAKAAAATVRADAKAATERERAANEGLWGDAAADLAVTIAGRLLARHDGVALRARFLDWLLDELRALPAAERKAAAEAVLRLTSAAALGPAGEAECRRRIGEALGSAPRLEFATDPALIAGIELAGPGFVIRNSWRADLARIREELRHERAA